MKKTKYLLFLITIILFGHLSAQTKLYFRPTIDSKVCTGTLLNNRYNQIINLPIRNSFIKHQYFDANNVLLSSNPFINFGAYFG